MGKGKNRGRIPNRKTVLYAPGAIKGQKSTSTDNSGEIKKNMREPSVPSSGPGVPAEQTNLERITDFFQSWGHWVAWFGFVVAFSLAYANFNNDVSNSKNDIRELKDKSRTNSVSIVNIEKESIRDEGELKFLKSDVNRIKVDVNRLEENLKKVEIEQARNGK